MAKVLQIRVDLNGAKPPVWRRLLISSDSHFHDLHLIIQAAMGWDNSHLYAFETGYSDQIGIPMQGGWDETEDARKIMVSKYLSEEGATIGYLYDFGDSWQHTLKVEKVSSPQNNQTYPICIEGKGNCPAEDSGGVWGYYDMLEAIQDKKHPEHDTFVEWLGEDFDPTHFDTEEANARLAQRDAYDFLGEM